jgi:hypothetical protein
VIKEDQDLDPAADGDIIPGPEYANFALIPVQKLTINWSI